jgi:Xaa-Pro aminopeptidase
MSGGDRTAFVQHFNHLPLARRLAWNTDMRWGEAGALSEAAALVAALGSGRAKVGVIGRVPPAAAAMLAERFDVVDVNRAYTAARMIKSPEEIRWLSLAAALTDLAVTAFAEAARPGISERALIAAVQPSYLALGGTNFIHYVHSAAMEAPDVAVPRQFPSGRMLALGDVWGYTGQVLRTFFLGQEPSALYRELHAVADATLDAVLARVRPGAHARDLVEASRGIEDKGFTIIDDLVHGYGGGYLPPVLGSASRPQAGPIPDVTLQAGMALVVQPNVVTKDGRAGVQTGHLVLVTADGHRPLQIYPRGYRIL